MTEKEKTEEIEELESTFMDKWLNPGIDFSIDTNINNCEGKYPVFEGNQRLMFITHRTEKYTEYDEVKMAVEGGCTWIQLRMKDTMNRKTVVDISYLCYDKLDTSYYINPKIIYCINDNLEIALECGGTALHLGKEDLPVSKAWEIVSHKLESDEVFWIGATANSFEDIQQAVKEKASYIGLGPYRHTETKKKLSPVLGLEGYRNIIRQCKEAGYEIPIFAIGGIRLEDVGPLMETGITGIAVSGAIVHADDPVEETRRFIYEINKY